MNYPKISIVTPSFNQGRYIEQTIQSVLSQNYPNLEYIIIDGGSTDDTIDIIKKYESYISYWISEPDKGQADAINKGFSKCTGEIFNWINSDDYYEPNALLKLGKIFYQSPSITAICGKEYYFNDLEPEIKELHDGSIIRKSIFKTIFEGIIVQPATFFRTQCVRDFFPLDNTLRYVMDRQLWWAYLLRYGQQNIMQVEEVITNFRLHSTSKSVSEGNYFDKEFDRLKLTLFNQLNAPQVLKDQLDKNLLPLINGWKNISQAPNLILAPFASFYAERRYIEDDLETVAKLMSYVRVWRKGRLTKRESQLWGYSKLIPAYLLFFLKKIKTKLSSS